MKHQILINLDKRAKDKLEILLDTTGTHNMSALSHILDTAKILKDKKILDVFQVLPDYVAVYDITDDKVKESKDIIFRYCYIDEDTYQYFREKYNNQNLTNNFMRFLSIVVSYMLTDQLGNVLDYNIVRD